MNKRPEIQELESSQLKQDLPDFRVGDTISVYQRIVEGNKERVQLFTGTVIARKGSGMSETVTLHRVAYGEGMERVFMIHSPRVQKVEVKRVGKVRSGKLYRLRGKQGKAARIREHLGTKRGAALYGKKSAKAAAPVVAAEPTVASEESSASEE